MHFNNRKGGRYHDELEACYDKLCVTDQVPGLLSAADSHLSHDNKQYGLEVIFEAMTQWLAKLGSPSQHVEYNGLEIAGEARERLPAAARAVEERHAAGHGFSGGGGPGSSGGRRF